MSDADSTNAAEARRVLIAELSARQAALEKEMDAAPYHKVGTSWWNERLEEMRVLKYRLSK